MGEHLKVGKVKDAHGLKGELYVLLFAKEAPWLKKLKNFHLTKETPTGIIETLIFSLKSAKPHRDGLIVVTGEIKDRTQAEGLKGFAFEIPKEILVSKKGDTPYLIEILGFEVFDGLRLVGLIQDFSSNNEQDLLVVESAIRFFEIPFVEAFIEKIDYTSKTIIMKLPEGLLDLCGHDK